VTRMGRDRLRARSSGRLAAQMAATPAASVSATRSRRQLPLRALHPVGRVLTDPGARPAVTGARFLRGGDPREPGSRPPQPGEPGVRPQGGPPHAGQFGRSVITDAWCLRCTSTTRRPVSTIPQVGIGTSHRNPRQRHPRLRHRPTHRKSRRTAARTRFYAEAATPKARCRDISTVDLWQVQRKNSVGRRIATARSRPLYSLAFRAPR
jgi:hypothetical protein